MDDGPNESPKEKEDKGAFSPFPTMKIFGPTGPV